MPPKPLRVVRLSRTSNYEQKRNRLLTYRMALAQPGSTVPLLQNKQNALSLADTLTNSNYHATPRDLSKPQADGSSSSTALGYTRRWVRDPDELCVASIRRSNNINRISSYIATYKFKDPQWKPFLLPEVHVLAKGRPPHSADDTKGTADLRDDIIASNGSSLHGSEPPGRQTPPPGGSGPPTAAYDVYIDYSKLVNLELISRHANFALRHLVQKGHAMYFVNYTQHSILAMRGLVESSYITCAYGIRGERLRTYITHVGPLDVRDVIEIDPLTQRVSFNLEKKSIVRGVVALSQVEGYGTWFQRKPMLWQRTRRVGALQSLMGAYDYQICPPHTVGRVRDYEVALLEPHVKLIGGVRRRLASSPPHRSRRTADSTSGSSRPP
ncbi:unnamed protein product [Phytomonas sp. EM1]|nr:unnamed protein product [Phytomonas sp. EM1]|eukprot:CCW65485.1 unnamed protein product [Phytomonas sp. isolate EM1]